MLPETLIIQALIGVSSGMVLFIVASGLSLIFGVLRVINFAHGSFYMLGAFVAATIGSLFAVSGVGYLAAFLIAPVIVALLSVVLETTLFRRVYGKEPLRQLLLTYGLTLVLSDVVRLVWGGEAYRLPLPELLQGSIKLLDRRFPVYNLALLIIGSLIAISLWLLLEHTRWGKTVRASVTHPEMVSALGIDVRRLQTTVFALGCWLAGVGGMLIAGRSAVSIGMDSEIIVQTFAVCVIGGLGSFSGALMAAMLIGIVTAIGTLIPTVAGFAQALPFLVMVIVLILRPYGLRGVADVRA